MEIKQLTDKIEAAAKVLRETGDRLDTRMDELEVKLQRQSIPSYPPSDKSLQLGDADKSFLRYIRRGESALRPDEAKALVEDTAGQYLVSPAIEAELQRSLAKLSIVRQLASRRTIDKDRIKVRDISEAQVDWGKLETGTDITETTPVPSEDTKYVEDLYGLVKIGEDELSDSDYDLTTYISDTFARAIAEKENLGFLKGTGHTYSQPDGITLDTTLVAATKTTAAHSAVTIDDFLQMIYEVPAKYRPGSAWIVNSTTELEIRKLRWDGGGGAGTGGYFWQPSMIEGRPPTFLGYPIYNQDDMDDLSAVEGIIAIFGNFQFGYRILDRKGITIQRLNELYAEAGLIGFKVHARVGGYLIKPSNKALVLLTEHSA